MATVKKLYNNPPQAGGGGLASLYKPAEGNGYINVVKDFPWTLTPVREDVPRVILKEYEVNETTIQRQALFYSRGASNFVNSIGNTPAGVPGGDILSPYEELYPKNSQTATGFRYDFPYISDINFEINTPVWASLDTLEQLQKGVEGVAGIVSPGLANAANKIAEVGKAAAMVALSFNYPKVGIMDRPRLWQSHDFRNIQIKFPLFNTLQSNDWKTNRQLCELLINQNLYNKRDFITSVPPVFYEVLIFGQHYSYASCVTNLTIYNRGNMRLLQDDGGRNVNVPDVYEINMTLTDMVMPSKNLFQSIADPVVVASIIQ